MDIGKDGVVQHVGGHGSKVPSVQFCFHEQFYCAILSPVTPNTLVIMVSSIKQMRALVILRPPYAVYLSRIDHVFTEHSCSQCEASPN